MKRIEKKTVLQMFLQFVDVIDDIVDDFSSLLMKRKLCCRCFFQLVDVIDDIVNDLSSLLIKRIEKKTLLQMY
jgi:hypothetical protein